MTTSEWSSGNSDWTAAEPGYSEKQERKTTLSCIKDEWSDRNKAIVVIVRDEIVHRLEQQCAQQPSKWKRLFSFSGKSPIYITNMEEAGNTIANAASPSRTHSELTIIVSGAYRRLHFQIPRQSSILTINIFAADPSSSMLPLLIGGSSRIGKYRIDEWEHRKHNRKIYTGPGVRIQVDPYASGWGSTFRASSSYSESEKSEFMRNFHQMQEASRDESWWEKFKGPVAAIVGVATGVGSCVAGFNMTAKGMFVTYKFGSASFAAGAASVKASAVVAAVGTPVLLGGLAATAVYYIPWGDFFSWMGRTLTWLWEKIKQLWNAICEWFRGTPNEDSGFEKCGGYMPSGLV